MQAPMWRLTSLARLSNDYADGRLNGSNTPGASVCASSGQSSATSEPANSTLLTPLRARYHKFAGLSRLLEAQWRLLSDQVGTLTRFIQGNPTLTIAMRWREARRDPAVCSIPVRNCGA